MNQFAPRKYGELQKVTERVYIYRNITNSSFVIGDHGVAVIDTQVNRLAAAQVLKAIRSVTDKPITHVINTHYHWDHTNGNRLFKDQGAVIIASKLTKEFMMFRAPRQKEFLAGRGFELGDNPTIPEVTFENEHTVDLGNMPLRLFFAGKAESDDATAVHVVNEGILMSGDTVMTGSFPIFGQPVWDEGLQDGEWTQTIYNLLKLKPSCIIPGHGPLAHEAEVNLLLRIQKYFLDEVRSLTGQGYDLKRILSDLEPRLPDWIRAIPLVWGTPRYAILRVWRGATRRAKDVQPGWQQFKPSAIPAASPEKLGQKISGQESENDFISMSSEAQEGGDAAMGLSILKKGTQVYGGSARMLSMYAEALIKASRAEDSVLEKGDFFNEARSAWDRALEIDPSHAESLLGKGRYLTMMAYRGGDDPKPGMNLLSKVLELGPEAGLASEAEFYLGMGYRRLADEVRAKEQFKKSLRLNPAFTPAALAGQC